MKLGKMLGVEVPHVNATQFWNNVEKYSGYVGLKKPNIAAYSSLFAVPTLVGIEIEVENIKKDVSVPPFWMHDEDGSLRGHGREFKSLPLEAKEAFTALGILWQALYKASTVEPEFSWRTSIHFHLCVMNMEEEEFKRLIMLAMVFEQLFFQVAGVEREQSNFCVPLCRSTLMETLRSYLTGKSTIKKLHHVWNSGTNSGEEGHNGQYKYSSTNFARLRDLGTMEFRHLGGTSNLSLVNLWLSLILCLYRAAVSMSSTELCDWLMKLNSSRQYQAFAQLVFGSSVLKHLSQFISLDDGALTYIIGDSVTKVKELLVPKLAIPNFDKLLHESALAGYATAIVKRKGGRPAKK